MFRQKTLFVLGAGASFELGLPTGEQLKGALSRLLNIKYSNGLQQASGDPQIAEHLRRVAQHRGQNFNDLLHKCWLINDALPGALSIDNLLDAHATDLDLVLCGKIAIAKAILDAEKRSKLYKTDPSDSRTAFQLVSGTWLIPFFQMLTENVRKEDVANLFGNLVIINFNYDRCVEYFLPLALRSYYGLELAHARECASTANIVHPYGMVGRLNPTGGGHRAEFGADYYDLGNIASGIRTFAEGLADEGLGAAIETTCEEAEKIVFLGYAFHPLNMRLLATDKPSNVRKIFATTLGFSEAANKVIRSTVLEVFKKNDPSSPKSPMRALRDLDEINLGALEAGKFLEGHFRGIV